MNQCIYKEGVKAIILRFGLSFFIQLVCVLCFSFTFRFFGTHMPTTPAVKFSSFPFYLTNKCSIG